MYNSKYYTCEQIDQRLLQGYFDDIVSAGYTGTKAQFLAGLLKSINYSANPYIVADKVTYNPASSGLSSKNVQAALDELVRKINSGGGGDLSDYLKKSEAEEIYAKKDEIPSDITIGIITNNYIDTLFK